MSPRGTVRMSADERRRAVLSAARAEFGRTGYAATSTEVIARAVGVSQPYLFRLFPTKKAIFLAVIDDCFRVLTELFETASDGLTGDEAFAAMGRAYREGIDEPGLLQVQLQMWAAAGQDEEIRQVARQQLGELWRLWARLSGADEPAITTFMAHGMLLNVFAVLDLPRITGQIGAVLAGLAGSDAATGQAETSEPAEATDSVGTSDPAAGPPVQSP